MDSLNLRINLYDNLKQAFFSPDTLNGGCTISPSADTALASSTKLNNVVSSLSGDANVMVEPILRKTNNIPNSYIIPFLAGLVVLVVIVLRYRKYLASIVESALYSFFAEKFVLETNVPFRRTFALLDALSVVSFSCFSLVALKLLNTEFFYESKPIILIAIAIASFSLFRLFISIYNYLINCILSNNPIFSLFQYNYFIFIRIVGFIILPISFVAFYAPTSVGLYLLYFMFGILLITLFYRLYRLTLIFVKNRISILYFILYLCGLEVVPILIVIKEVQRI